jgi:hypothetical protein
MSDDNSQPSKNEQNAMRLAAIEAQLAERKARFEISTLAGAIVLAIVAATGIVCTLLMMVSAMNELAEVAQPREGPQLVNDDALADVLVFLGQTIERIVASTLVLLITKTVAAVTWATGIPTMAFCWLMF